MTEWISVEDRLPPAFDDVLVSDGKTVIGATFDTGDFVGFWYESGLLKFVITHWAPLPPAPQEQREKKDQCACSKRPTDE